MLPDEDAAVFTDHLLDVLAGHLQGWVLDLGLRLELFKAFRRPATVAEAAALLHVPARPGLAAWVDAALAGGWLEPMGRDRLQVAPGLGAVLLDGDWQADAAGFATAVPSLGADMVGLRGRLLAGRPPRTPLPSGDLHAGLDLVSRSFVRRALEVARELDLGHPPRRILEIGASNGRGTLLLHQVFPKARIVAVETNPAAVAEASGRLAAAGLRELVTLLAQPPEQVVLERPADLAVATLAVHKAPDPASLLAAVRRSLGERGALVCSELPFPAGPGERQTAAGRFLVAWRLRELGAGTRTLTVGELEALVTAAGFAIESSERVHPLQQVVVARG